ncbi:hypothetical protein [Ruegeria halocynthiae]|uniref:hypothetical protein n=1 Tax=Ruegeria halocynthiae TaxID=985054 RepID=UPI00068E20C4|nr:hypothetical protein [Ruegeria halocynthiae]
MSGKILTRTGRPKRLKLEARIELARRYQAGETAKHLSEVYGVSRRHVTRISREQKGEGREVRDPSMAVSFRAAQSEVAAFDAEWRARGFANRSQALQAVVRARCGLLDLMQEDLRGFSEMLRQAREVSDGARVLAKAVQRGQLTLAPKDRATLADLLELAQNTHRELAALKTAAHQRRGRGWQVETVGPGDAEQEGEDARSGLNLNRQLLPVDTSRTGSKRHEVAEASRSSRNV